ncbi:hypothetical protein [Maricaulis sp.]|uniref:hypothetical protein n=1 Tax=Maricaulis sp. TaxID=1486257 RepID=UPI003A8FDAC0
MRVFVLALCAFLILPHAAEAFQDEIVVTGSRIARPEARRNREAQTVPHVHVVRRADNFLVTVEILSDTREQDPRREEVRATLQAMLEQAERSPGITVSMMGDGLVDLDPDMIGQVAITEHPRREDVSTVTLYLKTPVGESDDFDDADNRVAAFVESLQGTGRASVHPSPSYSLTLTGGADQYRNDVVRAIANDVRFLRTTFGSDYEINVATNLQERVRLTQTGPLELSIFLPYTAAIMLKQDD